MREMLAVTAALMGAGLGERSRCSRTAASQRRDARLHGRSRRPRGGRAAARSPRSRDGDVVTVDVDARRIDVELDDEEIARRVAAYAPPERPDATGVLRKYARLVSSASEGAVTSR